MYVGTIVIEVCPCGNCTTIILLCKLVPHLPKVFMVGTLCTIVVPCICTPYYFHTSYPPPILVADSLSFCLSLSTSLPLLTTLCPSLPQHTHTARQKGLRKKSVWSIRSSRTLATREYGSERSASSRTYLNSKSSRYSKL